MITVAVATVDSPTHEYVKAIAILRDDSLQVQDRRGRKLADITGSYESIPGEEGRLWAFTTSEGEVWTVEKLKQCGCGGTKTREK